MARFEPLTLEAAYETSDSFDRELMDFRKLPQSWRNGDTVMVSVGWVLSHVLLGGILLLTYVVWKPIQVHNRRKCSTQGHKWHWFWPSMAFGPNDEAKPLHFCERCKVSGEIIGHTGLEDE